MPRHQRVHKQASHETPTAESRNGREWRGSIDSDELQSRCQTIPQSTAQAIAAMVRSETLSISRLSAPVRVEHVLITRLARC